MEKQTQQEFLRAVKNELGVTWDRLAELADIKPRAMKTYCMPEGSKDARGMNRFVWLAVEGVRAQHRAAQNNPKSRTKAQK